MKQTAVDLMFEIAMSVIPMGFVDGRQSLKKTYEQAKEMEKEQMIDFALLFANSDSVYIEYDCEDCPAELTIESPDRLFNETYGGKI